MTPADLDRAIDARRGKERGPHAEGPTAIITRALERYDAICRRCLPDLSPSEWMAILDNLNGVILEGEIGIRGIPLNVQDGCDDGLAEKWHIDGTALVQRLHRASYAELVAVADMAERFWTRSDEMQNMDADHVIAALIKQ